MRRRENMVKLLFDGWSWRCEKCNKMIALPGSIPDLETLEEKEWKYCPYCGKKIDYKATKDYERMTGC